MDVAGAIVFLPREGDRPSVMLEPILFDPAALWLSCALEREGVGKFLVVCDDADQNAAVDCFPQGSEFVTTGAKDAPQRLSAFLNEVPGAVTVITRPVLLASEGAHFAPEGKTPQNAVYTIRGAALASALRDGQDFDSALTALGDAKPWQGRFLPLKQDMVYRAATVEPLARSFSVERLLRAGVRIMDTESVYVGPQVTVAEGATLLPGTILRGKTTIGPDCEIGPNTMIRDCAIGARVTVNSSQLNESTVDDDTTVGPFAYVRPHTHVGKGVKVGDFVELKNSTIGDGTKISHLTYVGDTDLGKNINLGCGTVTVNYDGKNKYRCTVEDDCFIGCNTNMIAPVTIGRGSYVAAGSTITDDVPEGSLAIAREKQTNKPGWADKRRKDGKLK